MSVAVVNLTIDRGTDFSVVMKIKKDSAKFGLAGYGVSSILRKHHEATVGYGFSATIVEPPSAGTITLDMHNSITSQISPGRYVYDVLLTTPEGQISKAVEGNILVKGTSS